MSRAQPLWFGEARFGLLVHWGPAALYARGERVLLCERLDQAAYRERAAEFDASRYDPRAWAQLARQAGMRYALLSAKLSDGYCLFDTATTTFNSVAFGARRDLVASFLGAFRQAGLRIGLSYALADWQCPAYFEGPERSPEAFAALVERAHAQVRELCTNYGLLDMLALAQSGPYTPGHWRGEELLSAVRARQPSALVLAPPTWPADIVALRQRLPAEAPAWPWQLELTSVQRHWGYHAGDRRWRSREELIEILAQVTAKGGNLALNLGPQADGRLPARSSELADEVGSWLERNGEAIYGADPGPGACTTFGPMTARGQTLYLHVLDWPGSALHLAGLENRVLHVRFLADAWPIDFRQEGVHLYLRNLPTLPPDPADTVIAVTLDGEPRMAQAKSDAALALGAEQQPNGAQQLDIDSLIGLCYNRGCRRRSPSVDRRSFVQQGQPRPSWRMGPGPRFLIRGGRAMQRKGVAWIAVSALVLVAMFVTACGQAGTQGEFTFGVVLVGPYNDHGWSEAHYNAGKYVEEKVPGTKMIYLDKLNAADRKGTTLEQVVDDMVSQGAKMIFTTSDDFAADTDVVAAKYPDIPFMHISGDHAKTGVAPKNVANYMGRMEYMKAVAGCAAALKTETKTIGYLGPLVNDETRRLAASAYLGCRECYERYRGGNPDDLRFVVTWIGFWFNIPGVTLDPTDVANDLFNSGVDVLLSGIDTTEAIVVAGQRAERGETVWAIPYDYENACDEAPEICLGTPYFNWGPAYVEYIKAVRSGKFEQEWVWAKPYWKDINDRDRSPVGYKMGAGLSEEDQKNLQEYIDDLAAGKVDLFVGPLFLQDGTQYLGSGEKATDDQIWYLPQLLRGMEGASS